MLVRLNMKSGKVLDITTNVESAKNLSDAFIQGTDIITFSPLGVSEEIKNSGFENAIRCSEIESILWAGN